LLGLGALLGAGVGEAAALRPSPKERPGADGRSVNAEKRAVRNGTARFDAA
jgi:hypothetical protein